MKRLANAFAALLLSAAAMADTPAYLDFSLPMEERVEDALARMTLSEKIAMVHAQSKFCSPGVQRIGIPEVWCTDGPHGIRADVYWDQWIAAGCTNDSIVAFPALTCLAATWNPELAYLYGKSIGEEARYRGKTVLLGPGVNICRTPLGGRNFEYMGEDPLLASRMVAPYVRGVQSNGVAACVKHYALNNHEEERHNTNVIVDDRALREIYLPAFKSAVKDGGAWAIMGAYNLKNDQHLCHNDEMLNGILKGEWGFDGVVISDWGGTHDTMEAVRNGLDLEFGTWTDGMREGVSDAYRMYYLADPYLKLINDGAVGTAELDDKCRRILRMIFRTGMNPSRPFGSVNSEAHYTAARQIAAEGIVLLKNDGGTLPVGPEVKKLLVVGENALKKMTVGGGSSSLKAQRETTPLESLRAYAPEGMEIAYERGYVGDLKTSQDGVDTGQDLSDPRSPEQLAADAAAAALEADLVIFFGGLNKANYNDCESNDRASYSLPYGQDTLIERLAAANPKLVVVNLSGNAVAMPWAGKVPAILQTWYNGSEAGNALVDVLLGRVNPSGKLPMTFYADLGQCAAHAAGEASYPGIKRPGSDIWDTNYAEGIFVGYRATDRAIANAPKKHKKNAAPTFPFGHGLSYTTFSYGDISASSKRMSPDGSVTFSIPVTNTGDREGAETVQLYLSAPKGGVERPVKELKGFAKVRLMPGETKNAEITISANDLAYYDTASRSWKIQPGRYAVHAASSAADTRKSAEIVY